MKLTNLGYNKSRPNSNRTDLIKHPAEPANSMVRFYYDSRSAATAPQRSVSRRTAPPIQPAATSPVEKLSFFAKVATTLGRVWQTLTIANDEPQVWQVSNRTGGFHWRVYDPMTNYSGSFATEAEVRQWLEQRYYPVPSAQ